MKSVQVRLSIMMFLQYAIWGFWLPVLGRYLSATEAEGGLGFTAGEIGMILGLAASIGAVSAPFLAGQLADRYFNTERFLAFLMVVGGVLKWYTSTQTSYGMWLLLSIAYSVIYMPTIALTNSLAFAHMKDPDKEFPLVRMWGTIGWIAAGWFFGIFWLQTGHKFQTLPPFFGGEAVEGVTGRLVDALKFSGALSIFYGFYCLLLPATPPKRDATEKMAVGKALRLFKHRSFTTLVIASLAIAVIHQIYFIKTPEFLPHMGLDDSLIAQAMSIGQFAEILMMLVLGFMLKKLGFRKVITIGAAAYFARYALFGTVSLPLWVIVSSQALHGICFACFFAAGFIYVDRIADEDIRHSAQTVFGIIILGVGPVIGGFLNGWLDSIGRSAAGVEGEQLTSAEMASYYPIFWYACAGIALVSAIAFYIVFRDETGHDDDAVQSEARRVMDSAGVAAEEAE